MVKIKLIKVDSKEKGMVLEQERYFKSKGYKVVIESLEDGDVVIVLDDETEITIERKTITDFSGSYNNKRMQDQLIRLSKHKFACVIIYGHPREYKKVPPLRKMTEKSFKKQFNTCNMFYNVPMVYVKNKSEYLQEILIITESIIRNKNKVLVGTIKNKKNINVREDINVLMSIGGIGEKKALLLLNEFKSPNAIFKATDKELLAIKNVGKTLIKNIRRLEEVIKNGVKNKWNNRKF